MNQLELFDGADRQWRLPEGARLVLHARKGQQGVYLRIEDTAPSGRMPQPLVYELDLIVRGQPYCSVIGGAAEAWPLSRGVPLGSENASDPFREGLLWGCAALAPREDQQWMSLTNRLHRSEPARDLQRLLRGLARHAVRQCDGAARNLARPFWPASRWGVYAAIAADSTGRVGQLAGVCPGALLLALALRRHGGARGTQAWARFIAETVAGRRLDHVLTALVDAWFELGAAGKLNEVHPASTWRRLRQARPWEAATLRREQVWLLKRAEVSVNPSPLLAPHPSRLFPELVPTGAAAQTAWLTATRAPALFALAQGYPAAADALALWLSRNALPLAEHAATLGRPLAAIVEELAELVAGTERTVGPGAAVSRLIDEAQRWSDEVVQLNLRLRFHPLIGPRSAVELQQPLPRCLPTCSDDDGKIEPISTVGALLREGLEMGHCVHGRVGDALAGWSYFFHAEVLGRRLTVEVRGSEDRLCLGEVRGQANRSANDEELCVIRRWLQLGPGLSRTEIEDELHRLAMGDADESREGPAPEGTMMDEASIMESSRGEEEALLGRLTLQPETLRRVRPRVTSRDFSHAAHRLVFECLELLWEADVPASVAALTAALAARGALEAVGGKEWLAHLLAQASAEDTVEALSAAITARSRDREHLALARPPRHARPPALTGVKALVRAHFTFLEEAYETDGQRALLAEPTAGRLAPLPSEGLAFVVTPLHADATATVLARNLASAGYHTLLATLPGGPTSGIVQLLALESRLPAARIASGRFGEEDWPRVIDAAKAVSKWPLLQLELARMDETNAYLDIRQAISLAHVNRVVLSRAHLGRPNDRGSLAVGALRALARRLEIVVVIVVEAPSATTLDDEIAVRSALKHAGFRSEAGDAVLLWAPAEAAFPRSGP